jgi:hypothetical protein
MVLKIGGAIQSSIEGWKKGKCFKQILSKKKGGISIE